MNKDNKNNVGNSNKENNDNNKDCLFCKIIKKEIPSTKIYENDKVYAFLDINPNSKGHTLVCTKKHYSTFSKTYENEFKELFCVVQRIGNSMEDKDGLNADGFNIIINNNKAAGQEVFHIHIHVIPRYNNDGKKSNLGHEKYDENEIILYSEKIRKILER